MSSLVMYDHQTDSLWSQFLGRAVSGVMQGAPLETIPVTLTTWEEWKIQHPETVALDKLHKSGGRSYDRDPYELYYESGKTLFGHGRDGDDRLPSKELVLGIGFDDGPKAYPLFVLAEKRVVNDNVAGKPVVVYFDDSTDTALAFESIVDGRQLTFSLVNEDGQEFLLDRETGTRWIPFTGTAVEGELSGRSLKRVHSTYSFWFAWTNFYPDTELYR